ncbi:NifB/NifX family molybdenum-iron cluster-binding protein [Poriferisphaera corsica]|uniref:NifB/NifX family molybdenum-iron cluster-binding protein n=1 Tax=Poriferisphaera corsica TaxID=2528020 RepID=UPI00119E4016|nr:NifB/NifX family molybdenum-iron cluster-binding protein [Poriferisphaera corsica]
MRIAIPLKNNIFSRHFGKSDALAVYTIDDNNAITNSETLPRTIDGCSGLPTWISSLNIDLVLVGGLGQGALNGLLARNIQVKPASPQDDPAQIIAQHLAAPSSADLSVCPGHDHPHHCDH